VIVASATAEAIDRMRANLVIPDLLPTSAAGLDDRGGGMVGSRHA
jgi:hypothetical protein